MNTARERFLKIAGSDLKGALFLPCDFNYEWFMDETIARWKKEGLPDGVDVCRYFGFDRVRFVSGYPYAPCPPFEEKIIRDEGDTRIIRDETGVTKRVFPANAQSKMPQWLDFPIKTRADWKAFAKRLNPHSPERYEPEQDIAALPERAYPLGFVAGSFYGHTLQRWVGAENMCMLFYDDPGLVHEMLEYLEYFFIERARRLVEAISFDFASFGEDIAYKGRPFISPEMFKSFLQPHYVRICDLLRRNGIDVMFVDSDGNIEELIPLWMDVGINGFSPLEAAAGMDAMSLKRKYGKNIVLAGNVDKRALSRGKTAIDGEIGKVKALLREGGYFPAVDHSVPPDVSLENFKYFLNGLRKCVLSGA